MKKIIIIVSIIVFFCFFLKEEEQQIRIRIIANSDAIEDQEIKNEVMIYLYNNYDLEFDNYEDCDNYFISNIDIIKKDIESKFTCVNVSYENHNFINKTYNNIVVENNVYKTLLVEIQEAKGQNFWGVLYSKEIVEDENSIEYKSYLLDLFKKGE